MARIDILEQKEDIIKWINENQSKAFICKQLHCKPETLNSYLKKMGIVYQGNKGLKGFSSSQYKTTEEYLKNTYINSHRLKEKLLRDGIKEYKCELCSLKEWQGQPIPLELHHKDGDHYNNSLDNLSLLCPNCHALQPNNSGAALKKQTAYQCIDCGASISKGALRCKSCSSKMRNKDGIKNSVSREELKNLIRNKPFIQIGQQFNVSDNAIRKWCDSYNLPRTKKEINSYSDQEWENI